MKLFSLAFAAGLAAAVAVADKGATNPISKVIQLLSDLQGKVIKEGEDAQKLYNEASEWCEDRARDLGHSIKTGEAEVETLGAKIAEEAATAQSLTAKVDELAGGISGDEADLKAATEIREHEQKDFATEESELVETTSMLERAVGILEREMDKHSSSFLQSKNVQDVAQALSALVQASGMTSDDAGRLTALIQGGASASDAAADATDDAELGAPAAAEYEGHSGNIVDTLKDIMDKAQAQLGEARKKETSNLQNFEMLKQSLEDEIRFGDKDLTESKKGLAASAQSKATAEGDLEVTSKDLASDKDSKADLHRSCMTKAEDFEAETKSRAEELKALAEAKKVILEATGGAESVSYGLNQVSFLQTASGAELASSADLANFEVVRMVRDLARKVGSAALAQLANRIAVAAHSGAGTSDPFGKIKGLIGDMILKLESEAAAATTKKEYCDKELSETNAKEQEKSAELRKLTSKIDQMSASSSSLKAEVADLQGELAKLAAAQAEMNKMRSSENSAFVSNKADMEQGLSGVKMALKILSEYYAKEDTAHASAQGAGAGIIGLLEVVESDFSKDLAEIVSSEETAASTHERETKENQVEKAAKTKDVEHKQKESAHLDKESSEMSADRSSVQAQLDAIMEYLSKIQQQCTEVAEKYSDRKGKREAEIIGLKEALQILESETALVQRRERRLRRRGLAAAAPALRGARA